MGCSFPSGHKNTDTVYHKILEKSRDMTKQSSEVKFRRIFITEITENCLFSPFSFYFCSVTDQRRNTEYSENEKKHGMRFGIYTIDEAIAKNRAMLNNIGKLAWNQREYRTLLLIKETMEKESQLTQSFFSANPDLSK